MTVKRIDTRPRSSAVMPDESLLPTIFEEINRG